MSRHKIYQKSDPYPSEETRVQLSYDPDMEKKIVKLPIVLREDCWQLELTLTYQLYQEYETEAGGGRREIHVVDIGLEDEDGRLIGWSGSERRQIRIHDSYATKGYTARHPGAAKWQVLLGLYQIAEGGVDIELTIRQSLPERRWLVGETHCHSEHSDGRLSVDGIRSVAKSAELDFLFLTDHNTQSGWGELRSDEELLMLPGLELTWYGGHANVYGYKKGGLNYFVTDQADVRRLIGEIREGGGAVSLNHPLEPGMDWTFGLSAEELPVDLIEVWNGPWHKANQDALTFWHRELAGGRKLIMTGGSDTHKPEIFRTYGYPALAVLADGRSQQAVLSAMLSGRSNVLMMPSYPLICLTAAGYHMGETVPADCALGDIKITVDRFDPLRDEIELFCESGVFGRITATERQKTDAGNGPEILTAPSAQNWTVSFPQKRKIRFCFALLKREIPMLGAIPGTLTNPVFFD